MLTKKGERLACEAVIQFMVAAGGGENDLRSPVYRPPQHQIGCGVTGMEGDDKVNVPTGVK